LRCLDGHLAEAGARMTPPAARTLA